MLKTNLQWGTQKERVRLGCGVIVVATVPLGSWSRSGTQWLNEDHAFIHFLLLDSFCASQLEREIWSMLMSGSGYSYTCGEKRGKCKQSLMYSSLSTLPLQLRHSSDYHNDHNKYCKWLSPLSSMTRGGERDMVLYQGSSHTFSSSPRPLTLYVWRAPTLCVPELSITRHLRPVSSYWSSPHDVCWTTLWEVVVCWRRMAASQVFLRGGREDMRKEWSLPSSTCCAWEDEREPEKKTHVRKCLKNTSA